MRVIILGSGKGSNAEAILQAQQKGQLGNAQVVAVISDQENAGILDVAIQHNTPARFLHAGKYRTKLDGEGQDHYVAHIDDLDVDLIVLAGFMRVIKEPFLQHFANKVINLHPSLLPQYPGLNVIEKALLAGETQTGCTVHYVTPSVDAGPIIAQSIVPIAPHDDLISLTQKVHLAEHALLPRVICQLSQV